MKAMTLFTTDLIWISGESTCWKHPDEVDGLEGLAKEPERQQLKTTKTLNEQITGQQKTAFSITQSMHKPQDVTSIIDYSSAVTEEEMVKPSFEALRKKYAEKTPMKKSWKKQVNLGANLMGITTIVLGVMAAAFMIKKAVDNIEYEPIIATSNAEEIQSEQLPVSTASHAAMTTTNLLPAQDPTLTAEAPPIESLSKQEGKKPEAFATTLAAVPSKVEVKEKKHTEETASKHSESETGTEAYLAASRAEEEKKPTEEAADRNLAKKNLQLSANNYKVGMLGGISNLEISVSNPGSQSIDMAVVEVEYLKPNGKVLSSQTVEVTGIAPGHSKKVNIPDHGRGVSVRYRVVNTER
jgi:hypothetical protein